MVGFGDDGQRLYNLLSGCPLIEELEMKDIAWFKWASCFDSTSTLKILRICWDFYWYETSDITVHDDIAADYKALDFVSLVEAEVLHLRGEEVKGEGELEMT